MARVTRFLFLGFILFFSLNLQAQIDDESLVQLTGVVVETDGDKVYPVPYVNIGVKDSPRGTYSDFNGFFSLVVVKGETVVFSAIGYQDAEFYVTDSLTTNRYSMVQPISRDTLVLPEAIIYPWPSKEHFKLEFLAMDVTESLAMRERALENLNREKLEAMREDLPSDGTENANFYLREQTNSYRYAGQVPPQNVFSPVAWSKFIRALKDGDVYLGKKKDR